ncbi:hypothetical protein LQW54_006473 [Pestalotiopsis sp. IQ-011]
MQLSLVSVLAFASMALAIVIPQPQACPGCRLTASTSAIVERTPEPVAAPIPEPEVEVRSTNACPGC